MCTTTELETVVQHTAGCTVISERAVRRVVNTVQVTNHTVLEAAFGVYETCSARPYGTMDHKVRKYGQKLERNKQALSSATVLSMFFILLLSN